jgi:hypothetical protein
MNRVNVTTTIATTAKIANAIRLPCGSKPAIAKLIAAPIAA